MENEFKHKRVCTVPAVGFVVSFLAKAMVGKVGAEVVKKGVLGAVL